MFDGALRPLINPPLRGIAARLYQWGLRADAVTITGMGVATLAALSIINGWFLGALIFILINRLLDGLDGPLARLHPDATRFAARGGYLDAVADFYFYAIIPLAFAVLTPDTNALPAAVLLASFILSGTTFLAFAVAAKDRDLTTSAQGQKSFYYLSGLMEGAETIAFFVIMVIMPGWFPVLAYLFAGLCTTSAAARLVNGYRMLS